MSATVRLFNMEIASRGCYYAVNMSRPSLRNKTANKQPIKAWEPAGFDGLYLEKIKSGSLERPPEVLMHSGVMVVFKGSGKVRYGKTQQIMKITQPTVLLQNPGEVWGSEPIDDTLLLIKNFDIPMEAFSDFLDVDVPFYFPNLVVSNSTISHHLARLILQAFTSFDTPASRLERETHLTELFDGLMSHYADNSQQKVQLGAEHRATRIVRDVLHASPEKDVSLAELASLTRLNKHYLLDIFKRDVGVSPHVYQTTLQLHRATHLLTKGLPVAQVALEAGFSDQSHLTNVFKKYKHVTPGQFRRDSLQAVSQ
jgi:AraC-like DNA-binding protein